MSTELVTKEVVEGAFIQSLKRNNTKIRADRAASITEDAQLLYKRQIEDLEVKIRKMEREQEGMLDMSPENATSLKLASDFNAEEYVKTDIELGVNIRNAKIRQEIAKARYQYLFGAAL